MRKLASIQRIAEIKDIPNADSIEAVRINGWWVVVQKNQFKLDDLAVYCEIDSWIPKEIAPFLFKGRSFNDVEGERLRTIKLRGQISQGLVLPMSVLEDGDCYMYGNIGEDVSDLLGIQKWEAPIPRQLQGKMKGNFPDFIRRTDQDRIQNRYDVIVNSTLAEECTMYEVTVKLDGSSMTVYWKDGVFGVCSRNIDLKLDQEGNTFVDTAKKIFGSWNNPLVDNYAIQGELMGPGIQGNRENLTEYKFFVFDIWDIPNQVYWHPRSVREFCRNNKLDHVPVLHTSVSLNDLSLRSIDDILLAAEGKSLNNPKREGIVFKQVDGKDSFKAIANSYLLKEK